MWRPIVLVGCCAYFVGLILLGITLHRASPGPDTQAITGVGIGNYVDPHDRAYISGRRLTCTQEERDGRVGSRCAIALGGETLEIRAWRNPPGHPNQLGGTCEARYAGRQHPCRIDSRHVHVHFFAYIGESLGLSREELRDLRRAYLFENLGEGPFVAATILLPPLTALVVAATVLATFWTRAERRSLAVALASVAGLATLPFACVGILMLTGGFFD